MAFRLRNFLDVLETIAPAQWAESWDNTGLQIGSLSQRIAKIFSSLDPTPRALEAASNAGAQLLFTHHPLIFKPLSRIDTHAFPGDVISEAAVRGVAVAAAHTNLDVAPGGINDILADLLGLRDRKILKPVDGMDGVGLGRIGNLAQPGDLISVAAEVKQVLGEPDIRVVGKPDVLIRQIAVVGGSGGSLVSIAAEKGADLLVTGDIGHHVALEADALGIALLDAGHFHLEQTAFRSFAVTLRTILERDGWDVEVQTDEEEVNPLRTIGE